LHFTIGHDKSCQRVNRIENLGRLIAAEAAKSGYVVHSATRFCLSYLRTNFRGNRLVYRRCDALFNLRQGSGGVRELAIGISDNFSQ
jgi:hypothetical protein